MDQLKKIIIFLICLVCGAQAALGFHLISFGIGIGLFIALFFEFKPVLNYILTGKLLGGFIFNPVVSVLSASRSNQWGDVVAEHPGASGIFAPEKKPSAGQQFIWRLGVVLAGIALGFVFVELMHFDYEAINEWIELHSCSGESCGD